MSGDVVARAKSALEGVADGPWEVTGGVVWRVDVIAVPDPMDPTGQTPMPEQVQEKVCDTSVIDAPFIAAARTLVPELVAEVERLRAFRSIPDGMVWQDYSSPDEVLRIRLPLDDEIERLRAEIERMRAGLAQAVEICRGFEEYGMEPDHNAVGLLLDSARDVLFSDDLPASDSCAKPEPLQVEGGAR